ncbi:GNAT family N-acetyltransferase [uncultured Sphingomonas sp.]|uniref:GNAT family N-acetyltransferase n=1 Tax=uncultured Sphingomonas sp. TaxID=158754 RepID=UPI0035CA6022
MVEIVPLGQVADADVEALLDRAFEPGRRARVSYRIRAGMTPIAALCFGAMEAGRLAGSIQAWPASLVEDDGRAWPLVMVGPVAVDPAVQGSGIGQSLMTRMLAAAAEIGLDGAMTLIGDPEYYGRFFGFTADRTAKWTAPGPVEPRRLLARGADVPAVAGMLGPRVVAVAEPAR